MTGVINYYENKPSPTKYDEVVICGYCLLLLS